MCEYIWNKNIPFENLKGHIFTDIKVDKDRNWIDFFSTEGRHFKMFSRRGCDFNVVTIEDICGDIDDLIGSEIIYAEESINTREDGGEPKYTEYDETFTWTFYKLATVKGWVDIRWYGAGDGNYSETVDICEVILCDSNYLKMKGNEEGFISDDENDY